VSPREQGGRCVPSGMLEEGRKVARRMDVGFLRGGASRLSFSLSRPKGSPCLASRVRDSLLSLSFCDPFLLRSL
jgi:hypothetical protein